MSTMNITFKHPDEIIDFLKTVCKFDFNIHEKRTGSSRCEVITWNHESGIE